MKTFIKVTAILASCQNVRLGVYRLTMTKVVILRYGEQKRLKANQKYFLEVPFGEPGQPTEKDLAGLKPKAPVEITFTVENGNYTVSEVRMTGKPFGRFAKTEGKTESLEDVLKKPRFGDEEE